MDFIDLKEQQKIIDSSIDKKLQLSKLLSTITSKNLESSNSSLMIDGDVKETITQLLSKTKKENDEEDNLNYKM